MAFSQHQVAMIDKLIEEIFEELSVGDYRTEFFQPYIEDGVDFGSYDLATYVVDSIGNHHSNFLWSVCISAFDERIKQQYHNKLSVLLEQYKRQSAN